MKKNIEQTHGFCIGFTQETGNGGIYEMGNGWVHRRIIRLGNVVTTSSLVNVVNGEEYLEEAENEFSIELLGDYEELTLASADFEFTGVSTPVWTETEKQLRFELSADVSGETLQTTLVYESKAGENVARKWLEIGTLTGWEIGKVTLEDLKLVSDVEAVNPVSSTDQQPQTGRFVFGGFSDSVVELYGCNEGLFALATKDGCEVEYGSDNQLTVVQTLNASTELPNTTAAAVIGAYRGLPEYGFYTYRTAKLTECGPDLVALTTPEDQLGIESATAVRTEIYNLAWRTPIILLDSAPLRGWLSDAVRLTKGEYLHVLLSMLGLLKPDEMQLLAERAVDEESVNAADAAAEFIRRFKDYFDDYRHLFGVPDGESIEGHAHFVGESGFIVLINPADDTASVDLPLNEPGIWLSQDSKHKLSDWSSLSVGVPMDDSKTSPSPQITLAPHEIRIIGVNIPL